MLPLLAQLPSQYLPLLDAPDAPDSPLPGPRKDARDAACQSSEVNLYRDCLTASDDNFFGVYQDLVYQNPSTHLDGEIEEYGKWQKRWENLGYIPTQRYDIPFGQTRNRFIGII